MNNNWNSIDNLGKTLENMVNTAVRMGDFGHLTQNINNTIKQAMGSSSSKPYDFKLSEQDDDSAKYYTKTDYDKVKPTRDKTKTKAKTTFEIYKSKLSRVGIGLACVILGVGGMVGTMSNLMNVLRYGLNYMSLYPNLIAYAIIYVILLCYGIFRLKLSKKFDVYLKAIGDKTYIDVDYIALYAKEPKKKTLSGLKKFIRKKWFKYGHLDISGNCLMTTEASYNQYLKTLKNTQANKEQKAKEEEKAKSMSPELRALLEKGSEYVATIRHINDEVPGEVVSNKMYKLEGLVKKIFAQVEAHPETADNLEKVMDYYLPMTIKLLSAYEELDKQPFQGDNIIKSKQEIENTIDSLNIAFEKIFDDMFEDTSFDVSADISVLNSVLEQDGLTEGAFDFDINTNADQSKK